MRTHRYAAGQRVSYAEDYSPNRMWLSGYEIVSLRPSGNREPQHQVRSAGQTYDLVAWESQLQEFARRTVHLSHHALRTTMALTSPERRARQNRDDPKGPSQHQDLTRWEDEGGAPRSGHHFSEPSPAQSEAGTTLYYLNIRNESSLTEDPEGNRYPDLQAARDVTFTIANAMIAEGEQQGEERRGWYIEITN
jgi:hypothetical protein